MCALSSSLAVGRLSPFHPSSQLGRHLGGVCSGESFCASLLSVDGGEPDDIGSLVCFGEGGLELFVHSTHRVGAHKLSFATLHLVDVLMESLLSRPFRRRASDSNRVEELLDEDVNHMLSILRLEHRRCTPRRPSQVAVRLTQRQRDLPTESDNVDFSREPQLVQAFDCRVHAVNARVRWAALRVLAVGDEQQVQLPRVFDAHEVQDALPQPRATRLALPFVEDLWPCGLGIPVAADMRFRLGPEYHHLGGHAVDRRREPVQDMLSGSNVGTAHRP
mmetsp:Transcript_53853/g.127137  ORF Transcript_53853/g.127137 Transcript_53853/m.127137 type:complete len:276 (+) Transcript_53853:53-880(+)